LGQLTIAQVPLPTVLAVSPPALTLGNRLGTYHFPNTVELVAATLSGSALLWRNRAQPSGEAWVDPETPDNTSTRVRRLELTMQQLNLGPADELHFIWCQGESDCFPGTNTTTSEYRDWAQLIFGWLAQAAGNSNYNVHLITLGALNEPALLDDDVNRVRDAFTQLPTAGFTIPGAQSTISTAANHYDLQHSDTLHLQPCDYVLLANRLADGIIHPAMVPRITSSFPTVISSNEFTLTTNVTLATVTSTQIMNTLFDVTVNGALLNPAEFKVEVSGTTILIRCNSGGFSGSTQISVRYVAGSGFNRKWDMFPPIKDAVLGLPLEPYVSP
jgi:hypothetical protein